MSFTPATRRRRRKKSRTGATSRSSRRRRRRGRRTKRSRSARRVGLVPRRSRPPELSLLRRLELRTRMRWRPTRCSVLTGSRRTCTGRPSRLLEHVCNAGLKKIAATRVIRNGRRTAGTECIYAQEDGHRSVIDTLELLLQDGPPLVRQARLAILIPVRQEPSGDEVLLLPLSLGRQVALLLLEDLLDPGRLAVLLVLDRLGDVLPEPPRLFRVLLADLADALIQRRKLAGSDEVV